MVARHLDCDDVHAALAGTRMGLANHWIFHVRDILHRHSLLLGGHDATRCADVAGELPWCIR
ncbi:hypothetical protein [Burkholderia sp. b14]|uniref:hypothetical protein n=1 Tax=Burkholderiaceae TaxID=119060 RepID=UPI00336A39DD